MAKQLFLVRHAHRETNNGRNLDNGLSDKGRNQAEKIKKFFKKTIEKTEDYTLLSSPKKRCQETLEPLSKTLEKNIRIENLIDEGSNMELRIKEFFQWWRAEAPAVTILCSHGDWIPTAVYLYTGARIDCKKGSIVEIGESLSSPLLINLIQKP